MLHSKNRILWKITPATGLNLAVMLVMLCFSWLLPANYGEENGPVEYLQLVVLGIAALVSFRSLFEPRLLPKRRQLIALAGVFLLVAIARELSWGRVFYMDSSGYIPPLKALWYGPAVYPVLSILIISSLFYLCSRGLHCELATWLKQDSLPLLDLVLVLTGMLVATAIEHHSAGLLGSRTELFEELFELAAYCSVLTFMLNIVYNSSFLPAESKKLIKFS